MNERRESYFSKVACVCVFVLSALLVFVSTDSVAATYTFRSTSFSWESAANNVVWDRSCTGYPVDDDRAVVNIGFTFNFAGINYTQVRIHSNGALQFGADTGFHRHYNNSTLPVTSNPTLGSSWWCPHSQADRLLLVYWDDINPLLGGTVRYETKGTAPNRRFVVSWENVPHYNFGGSYTFQIILRENGEFVYQYGAGNASGASATIGVEVDNTDYTLYSYNLSFSYAGTALLWYRPSGEPERLAEYWMEEGLWNGTPNEIVDWSGNGYRGVRIGNAQTVENGYVCRGAEIPANNSVAVIDAINTNIDVDATIGTTGSISFWYRSNLRWSGTGALNHQLFDATIENNRWFFLTKGSDGRLKFVVSDSSGTSSVAETGVHATLAGTWRHIAVTWRMIAGTNQTVLRVYVDGSMSTVVQTTTNGSLPSSLGTLYFGDNRSSVIGSNGTGNSANGILDEIRIYNYEISGADVQADMSATHPCVFVNHLRILHDGEGIVCRPEEITLQACADVDCSNTYPGNVTTDFRVDGGLYQTTTFAGGSTSFSFRNNTPGLVAVDAVAITPPVYGVSRCFSGATETCQLTFADAGFVVDAPDLIANKPDGPVTIRAVKSDPSDPATCAPAFTGSRTVNFWSSYENPNSGTMPVRLEGTPINTSLPGTAFNLNFDANAETNLSELQYGDAGQMRLNARFEGSGEEAGLVLEGSDLFVSRPVGLAVLTTDANAECVVGDHTCSVFRRAGEDFNLTVRGVAWTHDGDTDLNDNPVTPNYRQSGVVLGHSLVAPVAGNVGSMGESVSDIIAAGQAVIDQNISEVGVFRFAATPPANAFFGLTVDGGISDNIGRFIPHHFEVSTNTPVFDTACGSFTYAGQPFHYSTAPVLTVSARNAAAGVTQNYTGGYWKLTNASLSGKSYSALGGSLDDGLVQSPDPIITDTGGGTGTLAFSSGGGVAIMRNLPVAPFDAEISLQINVADSDGVTYPGNPARFGQTIPGQGISFSGGKEIRYGRMVLDNAYGPETQPLTIPTRAEYYNGSVFIMNVSDNCSSYASVSLSLTMNLANSGTTTASGSGTLVSGLGNNLSLIAPGVGHEGSVDLILDLSLATGLNLEWLRPGGVEPTARATFGIYKGNPRLIYMRESVW